MNSSAHASIPATWTIWWLCTNRKQASGTRTGRRRTELQLFVNGTAAIRETMHGTFAALPEAKITMNVVRAVRAGDDLAVLYNDWSAIGKAADGSPFAMEHKAMEIVRRQSDGT
jgi:hypothetical protein